MDWSVYSRIVDEFAEIGRRHSFCPILSYGFMGEPFLADDFARYIWHAQKRDLTIHVNTNASLLTHQRVDELVEGGFNGRVYISFHGISREVYERITGLEYDRTLDNVSYFIDRYDPDRICIRGVDDNWPSGERGKWFDFWRARNVQLEYVPPISRCGSIGRLLPTALRRADSVRLYGCLDNLPLVEMVILFDGRAVMCCQDMGRELIWGDVGIDGISGVWNGPVRKEVVRRLYNGSVGAKSFLCVHCERSLSFSGMAGQVLRAGFRKLSRPIRKAAAF